MLATLTDSIGNEIKIHSYNRIVSTVPSISETLFEFGLADRVVGVTRYCVYPKEAMQSPRVIIGGTKSLQINKIKELKPDLVIANKEENDKERIFSLIEAGVNVYVTYPQTVFDGLEMMKNFYTLLNLDNDDVYDKYIRDTENLLNDTIKATQALEKRFRIFCPVWRDPWMTINQTTFIHSIIELCGGINVFEYHNERYPKVSLEEVKKSDPEIVLLPDEPYVFDNQHVKELKTELGEGTIKYILMNGSYLSWYSPRMVKGIKLLTRIINNQR